MADSFVSGVEQKIYVYEKTGNQCTILAGYKNGVEVGQIYNVGIAKQIIHPITKKLMSGTTFTKIGEIKVQHNMEITNSDRENQLIKHILGLPDSSLDQGEIESIYKLFFSISKKRQDYNK